jgi:predicted nucleotidyltransferase component of viral defense system
MFYGLDRFSVDLDFDLLLFEGEADNQEIEQEIFEKVVKIALQYGQVKQSRIKRFNLFIVISYDDNVQNIKIEVNRRQFGSRYELKTLLGISMLVMVREDMFAHKLMAMYERLGKTSRDVYDVYYFAKNT